MGAVGAASADLAPYFEGLKGTFVLYDARAGTYTRFNAVRGAERFSPCSTYKIPNSLIAVETGVASGAEFAISYDAKRDPRQADWPEEWAHDQTLRSAFRYSVVWFYQEMARRVGAERMGRYVKQFGYGNQDIAGGIDRFWLSSSLQISAEEQVAFLQRFHDGRLRVSPHTMEVVKDIMVADQGPGWVLRAKTGACRGDLPEGVVWYVGWVEKGDDTFYFALNLGGPDLSKLTPLRVAKAREILAALGVLGGSGDRKR